MKVLITVLLTIGCSPAPANSKDKMSSAERDAENGNIESSLPRHRESATRPHEREAGEESKNTFGEVPEDMLPVPGGVFTMGSDHPRSIPDERPAHKVTLKPFLLDKTEVTNSAYQKCVDAKVCPAPAWLDTKKGGFEPLNIFRSPDRPVNGVSRENAETYCRFVDKRLPTEAEFERAARGDDARLYAWGDEPPTPKLAVYRTGVTAPVGSRPAGRGPYGHFDLAGNVWEWTADRYDPYAYTRRTAPRGIPADCQAIMAAQRELRQQGKQGFTGTNPIPDQCEYVLRGGAFNYFPWGLRASNRVHHAGRFRIAMAGFRCAKSIPDPLLQETGEISSRTVNP